MFNRTFKITSANENYVNEPSVWTAHRIFCLAWGFSKMQTVPHAHQLKNTNQPQNEKMSFFITN
ncbi:hypothetical protein FNE58_00165 [Bacillus thuringiensis]|nr:hypothetical protein FPG91_25475 [Bacillus thuringiensis]NIE90153.1 hypothetical protein [Bacillus sp. Ab-1751]KAB1349522.1 hypothetical protein FPG90_25610 [Bacillus thuringiensis]KAB1350112.1 hypothetical protein FPG94_25720 [Bacillus thuringiensis]KAB1364696.1 hypothetical protein FPG95_26070 [Bacillus thuringiensis]